MVAHAKRSSLPLVVVVMLVPASAGLNARDTIGNVHHGMQLLSIYTIAEMFVYFLSQKILHVGIGLSS